MELDKKKQSKVLYVSGSDYSASFFEDWVVDNKLSFDEASELDDIQDDEGYAEVSVLTFGEICPKFAKFVRDELVDYDSGKHSNVYFKEDGIFRK